MNKFSNSTVAVITVLLLALIIFYSQTRKSPSTYAPISNYAPSANERAITVEGVWECLPHKNTEGPQTAECAFGIAVDGSNAHYALSLSNLSGIDNFPIGEHVRVVGTRVEQNQTNATIWEIYPIDGIIRVTSVEKI